jgi:hypothetical protein
MLERQMQHPSELHHTVLVEAEEAVLVEVAAMEEVLQEATSKDCLDTGE